MGDHEDRHAAAVEFADEVIELLRRHGVEPRDGLVEQQELIRRTERPGKQHALLLAAGKLAVAAVGQVGNVHARHRVLRARLVGFGIERVEALARLTAGEHNLAHGGRKIALHGRLLRQPAEILPAQPLAEGDGTRKRRLQAEERAHERALARAVFTDDAEIVARVDLKIEIPDEHVPVIAEGEIPAGHECHTSASFSTSRFDSMMER